MSADESMNKLIKALDEFKRSNSGTASNTAMALALLVFVHETVEQVQQKEAA